MPKFVDSPQKEAKWKRAKRAVMRSRGKTKKQFTRRDWGLTTHIFQRIKKAMKKECFVVYYVSPKTGKPIVMQGYDDRSEAQQHLTEFKKRYGKLVQAGIQETYAHKTKDLSVQKFSLEVSKLKGAIKKCVDVIQKRKSWSR